MGHTLPTPAINYGISVFTEVHTKLYHFCETETMSFPPHHCILEPNIILGNGNSVIRVKYTMNYLLLKVHLGGPANCSLCLKIDFSVLKHS